jgi:hypothetical protein
MSPLGQVFSRNKGENEGGKREDKGQTRKGSKEDKVTKSQDLRSRFGEAFLPFAAELESVEKNKTYKKRRQRKKREKLKDIINTKTHMKSDKGRRIEFEESKSKQTIKLNKKKTEITNKNEKEAQLKWIGDTMTLDDGWPNLDDRTTMRIFHINMNGITYQNNLLEWEMTIASLMDMQVDIFGLTEVNLDMNNGMVKDKLLQAGKHFDPYIRMATSSSQQQLGDSPFKMGGTITGTNGCWSGRLTGQGSDSLGRWSYISMQAKFGHIVTIITVYIPTKPSKEGGGTTIYQQMQADLLYTKGELLDSKDELLRDLHKFIRKEKRKGNGIFLMGDMNDDLGDSKSKISQFMSSLGIRPTYRIRHGDQEKLPASHDRGTKCIDMIGSTECIEDDAIVRTGYSPFYFNFFTDHRGVYVDLDIAKVFNCTRPDTTKLIYKRFTTTQVPKCSRYLKYLEEAMERSKLFKKIDELEIEFGEKEEIKDNGKRSKLIKRTKILFDKTTQLMKMAERRSGPQPYRDGYPDSPVLRQAAFKVIRLKKYLRLVSLGTLEHEEGEKEKVIADLKSAQESLRKAQKSSYELREEHLTSLAEKRSHQWQMTSAEALHILKESERSKNLHDKHRRLLKSTHEGTLRSLMIPAPVTGLKNNIKDKRLYTTVTDSTTMFNILLKRNFEHLMQSKSSMFTTGKVLDMCGWYGEEEGMEDILRGVIDHDLIAKDYPQFGEEGAAFLKALQYAKDEEGNTVQPFKWRFGVEEYMAVFNKTKESTACGPSGLHMSHWKAACERPCIARVHAFFMWAAFEMGFTYSRWEQSWHCMIKKLKDPLLPKLRIVQLFEGDFNAGLKFLIGKKMMRYMNDKNLHDPETFGSRSGKTAPEALTNLQLLFDHQRIWRQPISIIFNDAVGCYDRIIPTLCELAMRAKGCPKSIAQCHTLTQKGMIHRIRIATGISEGIIKFSLDNMEVVVNKTLTCIQGRTGGIGQGGGAGPLAWIAVIDVMLAAFRQLNEGAMAMDPLQLYSICYWLVSYVDDNTIVTSFQDNATQHQILQTTRKSLGSWRRLLQLTGGDIDVAKSKWSIMRWKYCKVWGIPNLETRKEFPGDVGMIDRDRGQISKKLLGRLEPDEADRVLGIRLPMDGNMKKEYQFRCNQMTEFGKKILLAPLTTRDAWLIYESRYRSKIRYPLPVTLFTEKQCINIQKPFIHALLPKLGFNRNTPRVVIYGPTSLGGMELMDLRVEQVATSWATTRGHMRRLDRAGLGLYTTAHDLQVAIGRSLPFYELIPSEHQYVKEMTRWGYIWKNAHELGLSIEIHKFWTPKLKYLNDRNIMDVAIEDSRVSTSKWPLLFHINQCRLYIKALTIGDLTRDGKTLHQPFLNGDEKAVNIQVRIPDIRKPTKNQWNVWKSFLYRNFLSPGTSFNPPLGRRIVCPFPLSRPMSETDLLLELDANKEWSEIIAAMPKSLQAMVGKVVLPSDDGLSISEAIVEGSCVGASDGSMVTTFQKKRGSHGYALSEVGSTSDDIVGYGPSPESDDMSSLTTEHYGIIGLLVVLHLLCKKYCLVKEECFDEVKIFVDNKTVVERCNMIQGKINLSDYAAPEQDLWELTTELKQKLPIRISIEWVRGHQDENRYGEKINGPFKVDAQMNILTDSLARKGMQLNVMVPRRPTLTHSAIALYNKEGTYITDVHRYMTNKVNGERLLDYYRTRRGWNRSVAQQINWEGIQGMLRKSPPTKRIKRIKMMHNWQNVGRQKGHIRDARIRLGTDRESIPTVEEKSCHLCPEGCGEEEKEMHYIHCGTKSSKTARAALILKVLQRLKALRTSPPIMSLVGYILRSVSNGVEISTDPKVLSIEGQINLIEAIRGQVEIGWTAFCQGFTHKKWAEAQSEYYRMSGVKNRSMNGGRWETMLSTILSDYCLDNWERRNKTIHGETITESRGKKLVRLRKQVGELYKEKRSLKGTNNQNIFKLPKEKRQKMGVQSLQIWIGMAEEVLRMHRETTTKLTIHRWLQQR